MGHAAGVGRAAGTRGNRRNPTEAWRRQIAESARRRILCCPLRRLRRSPRRAESSADYQRNFKPNWVCLGEFAWPVMIPKELLVTLVFGPPKRGVLNAFRNSPRI